MIKHSILLAVTFLAVFSAVPGYGATRSLSLIVSATLPEHVMDPGSTLLAPAADKAIQMVQTQTMTRNHRSVVVTSIVVP